jgi:transcriptional regulator with XRE-family HTH domain
MTSTLKVLRRFRNKTQQELSEETGITARTIQRYESSPTSLRSASYKNLVLLANALNVTVDDFFLDNVSEFLKLPN